MSCTNPRCAFVPSKGGSPVFLLEDHPIGSFVDPVRGLGRIVYLPCGGCLECRRERRQELTILQLAEASLYDENWFITLTYDDEKVWQLEQDVVWSLRKDHLAAFNQDMRKYCSYRGYNWRFFAAGEYGDKYERPHYHLSVFGLPAGVLGLPVDEDSTTIRKKGLSNGHLTRLPSPLRDENGNEFWKSSVISYRWPYGSHQVYRANRETFQYVAGYVVKKLRGLPARDFEATGRLLPFHTQSRPSIGRPWFDKFYSSLSIPDGENLINDTLSVDKVDWKVPRIFSRWLQSMDFHDGKRIVRLLSDIRQRSGAIANAGRLVPDRQDLKRKRDFGRYQADHYKQNNKHKEIS